MHLLLLLLVAVGADVPIAGRYPQAAEVFHCTFDSQWDNHYDGWPAGWTRRSGRAIRNTSGIKIRQEPAQGATPASASSLTAAGPRPTARPLRSTPC